MSALLAASLPHTFTLLPVLRLDYLKEEAAFLKKVERDATTFRPPGTKIASYVRRAMPPAKGASTGKGKGKGKTRADEPVDADADDAVVYEVYHVSRRCAYDAILVYFAHAFFCGGCMTGDDGNARL